METQVRPLSTGSITEIIHEHSNNFGKIRIPAVMIIQSNVLHNDDYLWPHHCWLNVKWTLPRERLNQNT